MREPFDVSGPLIAFVSFVLSGLICYAVFSVRIHGIVEERDRALRAAEVSTGQVEVAQAATRLCLGRAEEVEP
jgi:hypothetical protein